MEVQTTTQFSHVHAYSLQPIQGAENHYSLVKGGYNCSCVMAMPRYILPVNSTGIMGSGPQVALQKETCNTFCPKCNLLKSEEGEYVVEITCAGTVNEIPVTMPKAESKPGKLLSV